HHNTRSLPVEKCEKQDEKAAQEDGVSGSNPVSTGDPGQAIQELGPVDLPGLTLSEGNALARLARATVVVIAVVCILEPLQIPVVPGQREIGFAIVAQMVAQHWPAGLQTVELSILKRYLAGDLRP